MNMGRDASTWSIGRLTRGGRTLMAMVGVVACSFASGRAFAMSGSWCSLLVTCPSPPTVTIGSSGGVVHPEVVPVFWGSSWLNMNSGFPGMIGTIQAVVNGPYLAGIAQYGPTGNKIGPARMAPMSPILTGTPAAHCHDGSACRTTCNDKSTCGFDDVVRALNSAIGAGFMDGPIANAGLVYMVFAPDNFTGMGVNGTGTCDSTCGPTYNGHTYKFGWVPGADPAGTMHELVEAITGNVTVNNCKYVGGDFAGQSANQIADLCGCYRGSQVGGPYAAYWSAADSKCVIPEGWQSLWQYNNSPNSWTQISSGTVRQVDAGGFGLIATDTSDKVMRYSGTPGVWNAIGGSPAAMYAVGNSSNGIISLSPGADVVSQYTGSGWATIRTGGSFSPVAATSVVAGGAVLVTDTTGNPSVYSGGVWTGIGGQVDQLVVTGAGNIFSITPGHDAVFTTSGTSGNWTQVGVASAELFAGMSNVAGMPPASPHDIWYYESGSTWLRQGGPGTMFAVTAANTLYGLTPNMQAVMKSNNTSVTNPSWTQVGGAFGRLVGGGNTLYATSSTIVY